jgi:2,4-dienoyl-CoA reductase-like NADH-dependent reductase (Old Yellow Enzyme family)
MNSMERLFTSQAESFRAGKNFAIWRSWRPTPHPKSSTSPGLRAWPHHLPLFVRISATDWAEGGWTPDESVELARRLREHGVDLVDASSGGQVPHAKIPLGPGYQVPFAARIRKETGMPTAAVGLITEAKQANDIIANGDADIVFLAREMLRDPYWPLHAAAALGETASWPVQYLRAAPQGSTARAAVERAKQS